MHYFLFKVFVELDSEYSPKHLGLLLKSVKTKTPLCIVGAEDDVNTFVAGIRDWDCLGGWQWTKVMVYNTQAKQGIYNMTHVVARLAVPKKISHIHFLKKSFPC